MTPARFRWGMILIQIGILILLRNADIINDDNITALLVFFPIVLIAIGIEKIFTKSKVQFISYLSTIGLFAAGFIIAFTHGGVDFNGDFFSDSYYQEDVKPGMKKIKAVLNLDRTDLTIRDAGDDLIFCEFNEFTRKPKIESFVDEDSIARIDLTARENSFLGGAVQIHNESAQDWYIQFSDELPLDLECIGYEDDIHLNLATSCLERLKIDADNASIYLKIADNEPYVKVIINGEESSLRLRIPNKIGLKIFGVDYKTYFKKIGLFESDDGSFVNEHYENAEKIIEIELDEQLDSFSLDYF